MSRPYIQCHFIAPYLFRFIFYIFKQTFANMLTSNLLTDTKIINKKRLKRNHVV